MIMGFAAKLDNGDACTCVMLLVMSSINSQHCWIGLVCPYSYLCIHFQSGKIYSQLPHRVSQNVSEYEV